MVLARTHHVHRHPEVPIRTGLPIVAPDCVDAVPVAGDVGTCARPGSPRTVTRRLSG